MFIMYGNNVRCLVTSVMILVMVLCDQHVLAFVHCDCLFSDQVLDVWKKHDVVKFHSECTYIKIEVKKVKCIDNPSGFFTMLDSLVWAFRGLLREVPGEGAYNLKMELASWTPDAGGAL